MGGRLMTTPQHSPIYPVTPIDSGLLERCAVFVHGWYGIEHHNSQIGSLSAQERNANGYVISSIYNQLATREVPVSDETLAAIGFRTIVRSEQSDAEIISYDAERLVPRFPQATNRRTKLPVMPSFEPDQFTRRAK